MIPLVLQAAAGELTHVTVFGSDYPTPDGTCVRDYIHVEDLARAHVLALEAAGNPGTCRVYNLGCGGAGYSVRQVIDTAARVTGYRVPTATAARRAAIQPCWSPAPTQFGGTSGGGRDTRSSTASLPPPGSGCSGTVTAHGRQPERGRHRRQCPFR